MEHRVSDVVAVLDDLDIGSAHFFGYSMGGGIGFRFAKFAAERARSLIIGGSSASGRDPNAPHPVLGPLEAGPEAFVAWFERSGPVSTEIRDRLLANDFEALIASVIVPQLGVEDDLPSMTMPFLVYMGELDQPTYISAKDAAERLPNATFVSLPGLGHIQAATRSDLVLPHVKKFLARVSKT